MLSTGTACEPNSLSLYPVFMGKSVKAVFLKQRNLALAAGREIDLVLVVAVSLNGAVVSHVC